MPKKVVQPKAAAKAPKVTDKVIKKPTAAKKVDKEVALWDTKQFEAGQYFSHHAYLTIESIDKSGDFITKNQHGGSVRVDLDYLEKFDSASHYHKEVGMTKTELAALIETAGDTVFSVTFNKQPNEESVTSKLEGLAHASLKDDKFIGKFSKEVVEGDLCNLVCHLVKNDSALGRSTVIDLKTTSANKFKSVDHRSITEIILRNVKYTLSKKKSAAEEPENKKWDKNEKPKPGMVFSGTNYFKAKTTSGKEITTICDGEEFNVDRDILYC